jgi:DNA-binding GntR family transcriptional regulator
LLSALAVEFGVPVQVIRERLRLLEDAGQIRVHTNTGGMAKIMISETGQSLRLVPPRRKPKTEGIC